MDSKMKSNYPLDIPFVARKLGSPHCVSEFDCTGIVVDIKHYDTFSKCVKIKSRT